MKKIVLVLLVLSMLLALTACGKDDKKGTETTTKPNSGTTTNADEDTSVGEDTTTKEEETTRNLPTEMKTGNLILVNNSYSYSAKDAKNLVKIIDKKNTAYSLKTDALKLKLEVVEALNRMFADFKEATDEGYTCITQAYADGVKGDLATGLSFAIKIYAEDKLTYEIDDPKYKDNYKWLAEHCHEYGFILRYPKDKASETGDKGQSNYFRYVGVPHATYIYANNLSLEGYIAKLKTHNGFDNALSVPLNDLTTYKVYYSTQKVEPNKEDYTVHAWSGNNVDGYIYTLAPKQQQEG